MICLCPLYTSDAADDSLRVDLGGRRIIKKWDNLAAACRKCNSKRGSSCWKEFLANTTKDLSTFETKMAKKVRKYVKRSEKFRHDMKTMKTWLETVKLPTSYKKELMLKLNLPQEMEKLYYE